MSVDPSDRLQFDPVLACGNHLHLHVYLDRYFVARLTEDYASPGGRWRGWKRYG